MGYYPSLRVGDTQELCIVNLMPMLLSPVSVGGDAHQPGFQSGTDWRYQQIKTGPYVCIRSTSEAKKKLENYKFTGFCYGCVKGEGMALKRTGSRQAEHQSVALTQGARRSTTVPGICFVWKTTATKKYSSSGAHSVTRGKTILPS